MHDRSDWMDRYEHWHDRNGVNLGLRPGASEAELAACERVIGRSLPADFRAWLQRHNGQDMERHCEFAPGCNWLASAEGIARQWLDEAQWADDDDVGGEPQCRGRVRSLVFDKGRIPIAGSLYWDGDRVYLDFSPGPQGTPGQVIALTSECDFEVLGTSFGAFMRSYVALLERGDLRAAPDGLGLPRDFRGHPAEWLAQRLAQTASATAASLTKKSPDPPAAALAPGSVGSSTAAKTRSATTASTTKTPTSKTSTTKTSTSKTSTTKTPTSKTSTTKTPPAKTAKAKTSAVGTPAAGQTSRTPSSRTAKRTRDS